MLMRAPAPLRSGDLVGITAPSAGVPVECEERLQVALASVQSLGLDVVIGECLRGSSIVSASASARARELQAMLLDPDIRAIIPPWGGSLGIEALALLEWDAIGHAEPTWVLGYSDTSALLVALTLRCGFVTMHGPCLMELPYATPPEFASWRFVAGLSSGGVFRQTAGLRCVRAPLDYCASPGLSAWPTDQDTRPVALTGAPFAAEGRLFGGCVEVIANLLGTPLAGFGEWGDEPTIVFLEIGSAAPADACRRLWQLRLAGAFDRATAILMGRVPGASEQTLTYREAIRRSLGDLGIPLVVDCDIGHVPPQAVLLNGARAHVELDEHESLTISQTLP